MAKSKNSVSLIEWNKPNKDKVREHGMQILYTRLVERDLIRNVNLLIVLIGVPSRRPGPAPIESDRTLHLNLLYFGHGSRLAVD